MERRSMERNATAQKQNLDFCIAHAQAYERLTS
jgi:hypothetical protein